MGVSASHRANIEHCSRAALRRRLDRRVGDSKRVKCAGSSRPSHAEEHHESEREPDHVIVAQLRDALAKFRARHGGDLLPLDRKRMGT